MSEPGISSGPIVAIAPAKAIAAHTAAAIRPMFLFATGPLNVAPANVHRQDPGKAKGPLANLGGTLRGAAQPVSLTVRVRAP